MGFPIKGGERVLVCRCILVRHLGIVCFERCKEDFRVREKFIHLAMDGDAFGEDVLMCVCHSFSLAPSSFDVPYSLTGRIAADIAMRIVR